MYVSIDNQTKGLDFTNSHYYLKVRCCKFDSDKVLDVAKITDTLGKLKANSSIFTPKC
jgi:hypothetical protein